MNTEKHSILSSLPAVQPVGLAWHIVYKPCVYYYRRGVENRWSFRSLPTKAVLWFILWYWQLGTKMFWVLDSNSLCPLPSTAWHCRCKNSLGISLLRSKVSYVLQLNSEILVLGDKWLSPSTALLQLKVRPCCEIDLKQSYQFGAAFSLNIVFIESISYSHWKKKKLGGGGGGEEFSSLDSRCNLTFKQQLFSLSTSCTNNLCHYSRQIGSFPHNKHLNLSMAQCRLVIYKWQSRCHTMWLKINILSL